MAKTCGRKHVRRRQTKKRKHRGGTPQWPALPSKTAKSRIYKKKPLPLRLSKKKSSSRSPSPSPDYIIISKKEKEVIKENPLDKIEDLVYFDLKGKLNGDFYMIVNDEDKEIFELDDDDQVLKPSGYKFKNKSVTLMANESYDTRDKAYEIESI
jgi:hypothetical protein